MKPITFENLRRLMGGGRKKKDKESSFKRSDSFKRISIRKSYLDRGKKKHLQKLEVATQTVCEEVAEVIEPESKEDVKPRKEGPGQSVIAYGQWLKGIRKEEVGVTTGIKGSERTVIYIPASDEQKVSTPVIRQLSSSPVFRRQAIPRSQEVKNKNLYSRSASSSRLSPSPIRNARKLSVCSRSPSPPVKVLSSSEVNILSPSSYGSNEKITLYQHNSRSSSPTNHFSTTINSYSSSTGDSTYCVNRKNLQNFNMYSKISEGELINEISIITSSSEKYKSFSSNERITSPCPHDDDHVRGKVSSPTRQITSQCKRKTSPSRRKVSASKSPVPRRRSPSITRLMLVPSPTKHSFENLSVLQRKESNDSAVEMFPWGDSVDVKKSPLIRRRSRLSPPLLPDSGAEEMCSLSISLGRIWMDAPQVMAPRSLELPRSAQNNPVAHNSLDSALKDLRDDPIVINRLQKRTMPPVGRTLSSNSNTTASTGLFSSKDSGFSFSISIPKLTDYSPAESTGQSKGFFRKKRPKPKLSVSRDSYFKRTEITKRNSVKRRSSRKKLRGSARKKAKNQKNDMYQVVVNRRPRCLKSLKLDPMIFVPPEKRKNSLRKKHSFKLGLREIRNFNPLDSEMYSEAVYESLPGDFDQFSDEQLSGRMSRISIRDDDEDDYEFPSADFFSRRARPNSSVISSVLSEEDVESNDSSSSKCVSPYVPQGVSPVPKRKPVRRRKSALSHKKSVTYVAKPNVLRAPSTLRRIHRKKGNCIANTSTKDAPLPFLPRHFRERHFNHTTPTPTQLFN